LIVTNSTLISSSEDASAVRFCDAPSRDRGPKVWIARKKVTVYHSWDLLPRARWRSWPTEAWGADARLGSPHFAEERNVGERNHLPDGK
jgi:hypothetical protein